MEDEGTKVTIDHKRKCEFCGDPALFEGETLSGGISDMCSACFERYGTGLEDGKGQRIVSK